MANKGGKPNNTNAKKYTDKKLLAKRIEEYFAKQDKNEEIYTLGGLAIYLGISRNTITNYEKDASFCELILNAKSIIENQLVTNALCNRTNPYFTQFVLKNGYGWRDKQEIDANVDASIDISVTNNDEV